MKGRKITATIDLHLVQVSDEDTTEIAQSVVQQWCDQVFTESLHVIDENGDWDCKFDVNDTVVVRVMDSEEEDEEDIVDAIVLEEVHE